MIFQGAKEQTDVLSSIERSDGRIDIRRRRSMSRSQGHNVSIEACRRACRHHSVGQRQHEPQNIDVLSF